MSKFLWFYRLTLLAILGVFGYDLVTQDVTGFTFAYPILLLYFYWRMEQMEKILKEEPGVTTELKD